MPKPKNVKYRILERHEKGRWVRFGVAYQRGDRLVLFAPPWRAQKPLDVKSLEELKPEHCPSDEFEWRNIETCPVPVTHPIQLMEWDIDAEMVHKAVEELKKQSEAIPPRVAARLWFIERSEMLPAVGAALEVELNKNRKLGTVSPKFEGNGGVRQATVNVDPERGAVTVFYPRSERPSPPPLVLLVPQTGGAEVYAAMPSRTGLLSVSSMDEVHFENVKDGSYLVVVIPSRWGEGQQG